MRGGNVVAVGGVTAGIDFALTIVAELRGAEAAQAGQLRYTPAPPSAAGMSETAPATVVARLREREEFAPGRVGVASWGPDLCLSTGIASEAIQPSDWA